jgi:transcriptional regulator with XRE-family HTH domain
VVTGRHNPTIRRRRLGHELRRLRETAGVTIDQVASRLECSASKISRIETGHTGATPRDVRDILGVYRVPDETIDELVQIAREARQKAWWHPYGAVLSGAYVGLEAAARAIRAYEATSVPGLLQTESYARAQLAAGLTGEDRDKVEQRVRVRMVRRSLLDSDDPFELWVVIDEAVLSRPTGGDEVMREQLHHLLVESQRPNVTIQVLPFEVGSHAGLDGTFAILDFDNPSDQNVVFAENATGGLFLEKEDELAKYNNIFSKIRDVALTPAKSVALLASLEREPLWKSRRRVFD